MSDHSRGRIALESAGGVEGMIKLASIFYEKAFDNPHLDKFIRSHRDPHGERLGKWIAQKLDPELDVWTQDLETREQKEIVLAGGKRHVVSDRTSAHVAAWNSVKRPAEEVGRRFKVDDCRIWMRLMFWSARELKLMDKKEFTREFIPLISHFIAVYERQAPFYVQDSIDWSASAKNIGAYEDAGCIMTLK